MLYQATTEITEHIRKTKTMFCYKLYLQEIYNTMNITHNNDNNNNNNLFCVGLFLFGGGGILGTDPGKQLIEVSQKMMKSKCPRDFRVIGTHFDAFPANFIIFNST